MPTSKSSAIDDILSKDDQPDHYEPEGRPGRKPGSANPKPAAKSQGRNQTWRAIEDLKANRRLDADLKEVYEEK